MKSSWKINIVDDDNRNQTPCDSSPVFPSRHPLESYPNIILGRCAALESHQGTTSSHPCRVSKKSQSYLLESYYATQRTGLRSPSPFFDLRKLKRKEKKERKKEEKSHRYPSALNQRQPVAILQKIIGGEET